MISHLTRAGDPGDRHPHVLLVLVGQEIVTFAQRVEGIDEVYQTDVLAHGLDGAADGLARNCFPKTADVDDSSRAYPCGDQRVVAGVGDLLRDYICPMHINRCANWPNIKERFGPARDLARLRTRVRMMGVQRRFLYGSKITKTHGKEERQRIPVLRRPDEVLRCGERERSQDQPPCSRGHRHRSHRRSHAPQGLRASLRPDNFEN